MNSTPTRKGTSTRQDASVGGKSPGARDKRRNAPGLPLFMQEGQHLPEPARERLEAGFGQPLPQVRIHADDRAAHLTDALDAQAFTVGSHIFLAADRTPAPLDLLAHEVAHALQQSSASPAGPMRVSSHDDASEQAAEDAAWSIHRGLPARPGPTTGVQIARQPRGGSGAGLSEEQLEDLMAISEPPSPMIRLATDPPFEVQQARYERGKARQKALEEEHATRQAVANEAWGQYVEREAAMDTSTWSGWGNVLLAGQRHNAASVREGGDELEQWLKANQKKGTAQSYAWADEHQDDWYGGLLRANAVFHDMSSEFTTGVARGGVTLGSGLLGLVANPVDTTTGLLELGNDLVNPFADKKELKGAVEGLSKPYAQAIDEGRYIEAGGRLFFDVASLLVGASEVNAATKGARGATVVDDLARTLPAGDDLARTLPAGDDLARTLPAGDDLAKTPPAPTRQPYPTLNMPGAQRPHSLSHYWDWWDNNVPKPKEGPPTSLPSGPVSPAEAVELAKQALGVKFPWDPPTALADTLHAPPRATLPGIGPEFSRTPQSSAQGLAQTLPAGDDLAFRPGKVKSSASKPAPVVPGEVEAAARARAPVVTHLSESFHRNIWESIGGKGDPPIAFRHNDVLFVDYERLSPQLRRVVDEAKEARNPGSWKSGGVP
jgi:hypothetical protein